MSSLLADVTNESCLISSKIDFLINQYRRLIILLPPSPIRALFHRNYNNVGNNIANDTTMWRCRLNCNHCRTKAVLSCRPIKLTLNCFPVLIRSEILYIGRGNVVWTIECPNDGSSAVFQLVFVLIGAHSLPFER